MKKAPAIMTHRSPKHAIDFSVCYNGAGVMWEKHQLLDKEIKRLFFNYKLRRACVK